MQQSAILFIKKEVRGVNTLMITHYVLPSGKIECCSFLGVKGLTRPPLGYDGEQGSIILTLSTIEIFV